MEKASFGDFGDVEVSQFGSAVAHQEDVGALQVAVENALVVQRLQPSHCLDEQSPYVVLVKPRASLRVLHYPPVKVPSVGKLHHYAQGARAVFEEGFFVGNDVGVSMWRGRLLEGGEDADFVHCVFLLLR